jgi:hypothetical protein
MSFLSYLTNKLEKEKGKLALGKALAPIMYQKDIWMYNIQPFLHKEEVFYLICNPISKQFLNLFFLIKDVQMYRKDFCEQCSKLGFLNILKWARKQGCPWDEWTCSAAASNGHLHILKPARIQGCPWDEETCSAAALSGHLHILKWARTQRCPWDEWTCSAAAINGHLHVLKWARRKGCPWNEYTCANANRNGHLHVLEWARKQGCPWDEKKNYILVDTDFPC